jgi:hypothetical protein
MMKKWSIFPILIFSIFIALVCSQEIKAEQVVTSYKTSQSPLVDGLETEDVWKNLEAVKTFDPIAQVEIQIKSVYDDSTIFFLVSFPDKEESRLHRSWIWNKENETYEEGPAREDVFVFKWKMDDTIQDLSVFSDETYEADIWYWKANRTDPQGFADDKIQRLFNYSMKGAFEVTSKSGKKMYILRTGDAGTSSYKTQIYIDYEGDMVHRYILRKPESSRADVKAKGVWKDGRWTIEFARALVTGNEDDVNFLTLDKSYGFGVSRYEIAGRPPEELSDQPLFGSGDITEMLTLEFQ